MAFERDRIYTHETHPIIPPELGKLPSVTTVVGLLDKSAPLVHWAVNKEREYLHQALMEVLTDPKVVNRDQVWELMLEKLQGIKQADKLKEEAATVGGILHEAATYLLRYRDPPPELLADERVRIASAALIKWRDQVEFRLVDSEQVVFSRAYRYAGRLDVVGFVEGVMTLLDLKTANRLYQQHLIQLSAYATAYEESRPVLYGADFRPLRRLLLIKLGKDEPIWEPYDATNQRESAFRCFLGLRQVYEEIRNGLKMERLHA